MNTPNGGPAFPAPIFIMPNADEEDILKMLKDLPLGMDLRDYFIAHAPPMPGWFKPKMLPRPIPLFDHWDREKQHCQNLPELAKWDEEHWLEATFQWPIFWADEMLKRREVQRGS